MRTSKTIKVLTTTALAIACVVAITSCSNLLDEAGTADRLLVEQDAAALTLTLAAGEHFTMPATNLTLHAQWLIDTYDITYSLAGGTNSAGNPASYTVADGTITLEDPTRGTYVFGGWYDNGAYTGSPVTEIATGSTGNVTLYAKWTATATVSYNGNSGLLSKPAYTFSGWNTAANGSGTNFAVGANYSTNAPLTLYAQWLATYTIRYSGNGNSGGSAPTNQTKTQGQGLTLSNTGTLSRTGYYVASWNTVWNGTGTSYPLSGNYTVDAGTTLYAQWTLQTYTITYLDHWGKHTNPTTYTINSGTITLTAPSSAPGGHNWIGWVDPSLGASDATLGRYMPGNKVTTIPADSTGNRTFYAWYEPVPRVTGVYFVNQAGDPNYINISDYIQVSLSAPLGSGCHPGMVRGGGQVGFNGADADNDGGVMVYTGATDWVNDYDSNGELYNLNMGWLYSTDSFSSVANGVKIYLSANLSADGRTLYLYITNWTMNPTDKFQVFSAANTVYFQGNGHWLSVGGNWFNTDTVFNSNGILW